MTSFLTKPNEAAQIIVNTVRQEDCEDLWHWRNDPHTRASSLNTDSVPFDQHCKWFESALRNTNQFLLLGSIPNMEIPGSSNKIGMVRFDIESVNNASANSQTALVDKKAIVSINLNPNFRGKGLSAPLLSMAVEVFKTSIALPSSTLSQIRFIEATIKEDNQASIMCFQRAGFAVVNANNPQNNDSVIMDQRQFHLLLD